MQFCAKTSDKTASPLLSLDIGPGRGDAEFARCRIDKLQHRKRFKITDTVSKMNPPNFKNSHVLSVFNPKFSLIEIYYEALRNTSS